MLKTKEAGSDTELPGRSRPSATANHCSMGLIDLEGG